MLEAVAIRPVPELKYCGGFVANHAEREWAKNENDYFNDCIQAIPWDFRPKVISEYQKVRRTGERNSNVFMRELKEVSSSIKHGLAQNDSELILKAREYSEKCERIYTEKQREYSGDVDAVFSVMAKFVADVPKMVAPDVEAFGSYGACMRMCCAKWWRRQLRKIHARGLESLALKLNHVNDYSGIYVSDATAKRRAEQRKRNVDILKRVKASNEQGQEYPLHELSELSVSNPKLRRMELMTRIDGFERFSNWLGFKAMFYTITTPSRMHSALSKGGLRNPKYDGTTPVEAQAYLANQWAKVRAEFKRQGLIVFGFRVVEPHHDGTPHWHMLFFMPRKQRNRITEIIRRYALEVDGDEKGADKYRFKAEVIKTGVNPRTGREFSAAGYIAKYISKAIDAYGVEEDLYGNNAKSSAQRIEAWASTWGIRQFQQIGGPSVTVWRELRRLGDEEVLGSVVLENAREASNAGDWFEYCRLNWHGQVSLMRKEVSGVGMYGDEKQKPIWGVEVGSVGVVTRRHVWQIGEAVASQPQVDKPWTGVNNCTEENLESALAVFTDSYKTSHHARVSWAIEQGFSPLSAFEQVKRVEMRNILKSQFGFEGDLVISDEFGEKLRDYWLEARPREMLLEEFDELNLWCDANYAEFVEEDFSEYVRDYLWEKYCISWGLSEWKKKD